MSSAEPKPRSDAPRLSTSQLERSHYLLIGGAIVCLTGILGYGETTILAALGLLIVVAISPAAPWLFLGYTAALLGAAVLMSDLPLNFGAFKLYGVDFMIPLLGYGFVYQAWQWARGNQTAHASSFREERWLVISLFVFCAYGLIQLVYGLVVQGYAYDKVFGDFRRMFFYALAFLLPLWIPLTRNRLQQLKFSIVAGALLLICIGSWRIITGNPVRLDENLATGYVGFRMLSVSEYAIGALLIAYFVSVLRLRARILVKMVAVTIAGAVATLMLLSGFRLAVIYVFAAPAMTLVAITWIGRNSIWGFFRMSLLVSALALPVAILAGFIFQDQFEKMIVDMRVRSMDAEVTGDYRQWAWGGAFEEFQASPIIGKGIGHDLYFLNRTRAGFFQYKHASTHSTVVSILYQTGIVGLALYGVFNALFVWAIYRHARNVKPTYKAVLTAAIIGYFCIFGAGCTQPLHVAGYVACYLSMGIAVRLLRETNPAEPAH